MPGEVYRAAGGLRPPPPYAVSNTMSHPVINPQKLNEGVLNAGDTQDKVLGKIGSDGGENNEFVGNGVEDRYKQDLRLLTLAPN